MAAARPNRFAWPRSLQEREKLSLSRGDAVSVSGQRHVIIGFDGRNDSYICWRNSAAGGEASEPVRVTKYRAHHAERLEAEPTEDLPAVDHRGRPLEDGVQGSGCNTPSRSGTPLRCGPLPSAGRVKEVNTATLPQEQELRPSEFVRMASTAESETDLAPQPGDFGPSVLQSPGGAQQRCRICLWLTPLLLGIGNAWRRFQQLRAANSVRLPGGPQITPTNSVRLSLGDHNLGERSLSKGFEDLRITVPIVKPTNWTEVERHLQNIPVSFDERGVKETMTVKPHRWDAFVNRQRVKLQAELQTAIASGDVSDEDVGELRSIIERMVDWQDLAKYSGKNISMASTRRGNEMRIHVMAFAEREDGQGVDFMKLEYRKSVEVAKLGLDCENRGLLGIMPWSSARADSSAIATETEDRWVQLMQRPDIAKFTIALAFRQALETEGIDLEFCEAETELSNTNT